MKKSLFALLLTLCGSLAVWAQQTPVYYGFAPTTMPASERLSAIGLGENGVLNAAICLDPATDPVVARLKGKKVIGVRVCMRVAYEQAFDERSYITAFEGELSNTPTQRKYVDFKEGWNDLYFDSPITIGDEPLYVGLRVLEMLSIPYPIVSLRSVYVPGNCWLRLTNYGTWEEHSESGTPLILAILEDDAAETIGKSGYAQVSSAPLAMAPSVPVAMEVYLRNNSSTPVQTIQVEALGEGDAEPNVVDITLPEPLAAYDATIVNAMVAPGSETGTAQTLTLSVSALDGEATQEARAGVSTHFVNEDAFVRIPVIEEYTSQRCTNCPYMIYYLEKAREQCGIPTLYVTHHTGYANDAFTQSFDEQLHYLFGTEDTYNPAIMYNRSCLEGEVIPVKSSTGEPSPDEYIADISEAQLQPASAKVLVETTETDGRLACRVYGQLSRDVQKELSSKPVYLTVYLVEDSISAVTYPQLGLDVEDAPSDLASSFRHNGVVRHSYTLGGRGEVLTVADDASFDVSFEGVTLDASWKKENMQVMALVHYVNADDIKQNAVLNAGSDRMNKVVSGIDNIVRDGTAEALIYAYVGADRTIRSSIPSAEMRIYDLEGRQRGNMTPLTPGVYLVRFAMQGAKPVVQKLIVK